MCFKSDDYEIIVDSEEGSGYAVGKDHMIAGDIHRISKYEYIEFFRYQLIEPLTAEVESTLLELDHAGKKYTLVPGITRIPVRIDKFAAVAAESFKLAERGITKGVIDALHEKVSVGEGLADWQWCSQILRKKFGDEVYYLDVTQELVQDLQASVADRGFPAYTIPKRIE